MRNASFRPARTAAVLATAVALGGLSLTSASPAGAVVLDPISATQPSVEFNYDAPGAETCTESGAGDVSPVPVPLVADGLPHTTTASSSATYTHDTDLGDITNLAATTSRTVTVSQAGGQLSHLSVLDTFSATTSSTRGAAQRCNANVTAGSTAELAFDLIKPTYVTVSVTARGMIEQAVVASSLSALGGSGGDAILAAALAGGKHATGEGRVLLPAGTFYIGIAYGQGGVTAPASASGQAQVEVSFDEPGLAMSATTGKGKKYVELPAASNCTTKSAVATWKAKAGKKKHSKIKKATFKVENTKVGSAKKPVKKKTTTLTGLPTENAFTITGTIKLASGKTVTVSRDYQACS